MADKKKREELKNRIEAGQQRHANRTVGDYAREARDNATAFVKEHPVATVVGGVAIGVIVASMVPGPGRRMRKKATKRGSGRFSKNQRARPLAISVAKPLPHSSGMIE